MHQIQKGKQWFFGLKAHIGVDTRTGLTHSLSSTVANKTNYVTGTDNIMKRRICRSSLLISIVGRNQYWPAEQGSPETTKTATG
jgi:hypothetical protein